MKRDTHATMFALVNEWNESGIPIRAYAQKKGISKSKLEYWIRKQEATKSQEAHYPAFIEVSSISHPAQHSVTENSLTPKASHIEVTFPSGLYLKIFG